MLVVDGEIGEIKRNSVQAVLRLLMFTVYADRVQKTQEMTEIWKQIPTLKVFTEGGFFPGVKGLIGLINDFDAEMRDLMDSPSLDNEIETTIGLIDSPILIPMVLAGMQAIANSDGEYHHMENAIIERSSKIWEFPTG